MKKEEIELKVRNILESSLGDEFPVKDLEITQKFEDVGINSVNFIKSIVIIESEFDFEFDDDDLNVINFENLLSLINYIDSKINIDS